MNKKYLYLCFLKNLGYSHVSDKYNKNNNNYNNKEKIEFSILTCSRHELDKTLKMNGED
jgi:hypothetical protein